MTARASLLSLLLITIASMFAACSTTADNGPATQPAAELQAQADALLPALTELREVSGQKILSRDGNENQEQSPGAVVDGTSLILDAGSSDLEWAIFAFNPDSPLISVSLDVTAGAGSEYWVALPDYGSGRWTFEGPLSAPADFDLAVGEFLSPAFDFYCAVIVPAGSSATVTDLELAVQANDLPSAAISADVESGDAPLLVQFDASGSSDPDGSIIMYEWDADGDGVFETNTGSVAQHSFTYVTPGLYEPVVRIYDDIGATADASMEIAATIGGNLPPIASISPSVSEGDPSFTVNFDASASLDHDGTITQYEWDLDGDGVFEQNTAGVPSASAEYIDPLIYQATLKITDNGGLTATASVPIVCHGWRKVSVWPSGGSNSFALAEIEGHPALIARQANSLFIYARSTTPYGLATLDWPIYGIPASFSHEGGALLEVEGRPAVSFRSDLGVFYSRSSSLGGELPENWTQVPVSVEFAITSSFAMVDGKPAIAYNTFNNNIRYTRSSTATGSSALDWATIPVDALAELPGEVSLAEVGGKPAIGVTTFSGGDLFYFSSSTADGAEADWSSATSILSEGVLGEPISLLETAGRPLIAYCEAFSNDLRVAVSSTAAGAQTADWTTVLVDSAGMGFADCMLARVDGRPAVVYTDLDKARFASSSTPEGDESADWDDLDDVTASSTIGPDCAIAEIGGFPAVVYRHFDDIVYAIRF